MRSEKNKTGGHCCNYWGGGELKSLASTVIVNITPPPLCTRFFQD